MKAKEVLKLLQITRVTLCHYVKNGKLIVHKLHNDHYDYDEESVYKLMNKSYRKEDTRQSVLYVRVSNPPRKYAEEQEKRLLNFCTSKGITIDKTFLDIKSGMNFERLNFQKLIDEVLNNQIKIVVVENKDRLIRFGFDLLKHIFKKYNCEIIVANEQTEKSYEQELTEDLLSIIHYFSMKSYSRRRTMNRLKKEINDNIQT